MQRYYASCHSSVAIRNVYASCHFGVANSKFHADSAAAYTHS